jgi:hypothetical protein
VHAGIKSPGWTRLAVVLLIPCADVPEIVDGLVKGQPVKRLVVTADQYEAGKSLLAIYRKRLTMHERFVVAAAVSAAGFLCSAAAHRLQNPSGEGE